MAVRSNTSQISRSYYLNIDVRGTEVSVQLFDARTLDVGAIDVSSPSHLGSIEHLHDGRRYRLEDATASEIKSLGLELAHTALPRKILDVLSIGNSTSTMRLGIGSQDPRYRSFPWEFTWIDGDFHGPLGLHPQIDLYHQVAEARQSEKNVLGSRRILVVTADPQSARYPHLLGSEAELASIVRALQAAECSKIEVEVLRYATPSSLRRSLAERPASVVHFIGHGDIRPSGGAIVLEGEGAQADSLLYADELAELALKSGTHLVILSCCLSAGIGSALACDLASAGIPAVIGMQLPIKDRSAHLFSRALYASLSEGCPIETAVSHGRSAIAGIGIDWGAPTLVISTGHGFTLQSSAPERTGSPLTTQNHNLPIEDRPFIGRETEKADLRKLIVERKSRLITVTGMGGMGKTRLAKQVALESVGSFDDGVWLIECEALANGDEIIAALSLAVGLEANPVSEGQLFEHLKAKKMLLVFDCMERLAGHSEVMARIVRSGPGIQALVTSRVLLDIPAEREYTLEPMSNRRKKEKLADSIRLFIEAASFADPGFALTRKNQKSVEALIQDLESVPLAIVLAAGRLRHMSLEQLADRVRSQKLEVLRRKPVGPNDRHADLLRVVGDSMELLFEEDRALMKALSVFRGGFFMKDAEAVLGSTPGVTDGIGLLRDNSLLRCQVVNASMRFRILDTVREYLDRVAKPEELHSIREKHANHFSVEAARIRDLFNKGEYAQAREQLWLDIGNFRAAVQFSIQDGNQDVVCVFAGSLARVYFEAGAKDEFETLAIAAEGSASLNDRHLLIELHGLHGELCRRDNVPEKAKLHWRKRAQLCRELEDVEAEADSYLDIADLAMGLKDLTTVEEMLAAFGRLEGRLALGPVLASGVVIRAKTQLYRGQLADALESCRRVEEIMSAVQVDRQALFVWIALAQIYRSAGSPDDCIRLCSRLLSDALISGHYLSAGKALLELSNVYEQTGKASLAASSIVVACLIPRAVSSVLRDQCLKRKQELAKAIGPELLDLATSSCSQGDWQDHAWIHVRPEMSPATQ